MTRRIAKFLSVAILVAAFSASISAQQESIEELRARAEAGGDAAAQYNLGLMYDNGRGVPQDYAEAARWYRLAAEQGHPVAQYNLGFMYVDGSGVPQDDAEAVRWFRLAADQGDADAQVNLGSMYANGSGVPQDDAEAVRWFRLAGEQGHAAAQSALGIGYRTGRGVPQDEAEAVRWYRLAADQGDAYAQSTLGFMYDTGEGVPEDDAEAVRWYRLAAEQGLAQAQYNLGTMYIDGRGVPQDDAESVRSFRLAAEQGLVQAQYNLGFMYDNGRGVPQDDAEAARWYRLAADQGDANAQYSLGLMYEDGRGVPQDDVQAYVWSSLSAAQGDDDARTVRDRVAGRLTPGQRAEAQRLARDWRPRNTPSPGGSVPRIEDADPSEFRGGTGTAFIVDPSGVLLTAHHVVDQATSITVSCNGRAPVAATVTSSSPTVDLAVLTAVADLGTNTYLELSSSQPGLGDDVFTIGYPTPALLGRDAKYTNGTVSALSGVEGDASFLQISVPVQPGNSGGPLVNEETGDVIGVVVSTADAPTFIRATDSIPQNINWAVKSVFASALFTPPAGSAASTVDPEDVIAHVTEATCLVDVTGAAR
jgi:hypothetical protein